MDIQQQSKKVLKSNRPVFNRNQELIEKHCDGLNSNGINPKTGMANRFCFELISNHLIKNLGNNWGAAVIAIEVDDCAEMRCKINRKIADSVMQITTEVIAAQLRPNDLMGHINNHTLLSFLPLENKNELAPLIQEIRLALAKNGYFAISRFIKNTASIGIRLIEGSNYSASSLVNESNEALKKASRFGSNRVGYYQCSSENTKPKSHFFNRQFKHVWFGNLPNLDVGRKECVLSK